VIEGRRICNLALIGFMGTGKSSVGQMAATTLGFEFVDTDQLIEQASDKRISEIFAQDGEPVFRDWERSIVAALANRSGLVISTGGGLPVHTPNLESLQQHSLVVCLWASAEAIYERVRGHSHRPLLLDPNPLEKIRQLLHAREPVYRQADVLISTDQRSVREVCLHVVGQYRAALGK
jgi:shikimate kinase